VRVLALNILRAVGSSLPLANQLLRLSSIVIDSISLMVAGLSSSVWFAQDLRRAPGNVLFDYSFGLSGISQVSSLVFIIDRPVGYDVLNLVVEAPPLKGKIDCSVEGFISLRFKTSLGLLSISRSVDVDVFRFATDLRD